jgi:hypothetical protein
MNQKQQLELRFRTTITGFNEEFTRILFNHIREAVENGNFFTVNPEKDDYHAVPKPGMTSAAYHLAEQMKGVSIDTNTRRGILQLIAEAEAFLSIIE